MINRIGRAKVILNEEGFLALFKRLLPFLKQSLFKYSSFDIYEASLDDVPIIPCQVKDLTLRVITRSEEVDQIASDELVAVGFNFARDKEIVSMGAILFYAFVGNDLAHVTQVFIGRRAHEIYPFSFAMPYGHTVGQAWFTVPKYRRKAIHLYTHSKALQYLREQGISRAWGVLNKDNIAIRSSLVKVGSYLWGEGCRLRLLSRLTFEWTKPRLRVESHRIRCSMYLKR